jgi:hypothetical protein
MTSEPDSEESSPFFSIGQTQSFERAAVLLVETCSKLHRGEEAGWTIPFNLNDLVGRKAPGPFSFKSFYFPGARNWVEVAISDVFVQNMLAFRTEGLPMEALDEIQRRRKTTATYTGPRPTTKEIKWATVNIKEDGTHFVECYEKWGVSMVRSLQKDLQDFTLGEANKVKDEEVEDVVSKEVPFCAFVDAPLPVVKVGDAEIVPLENSTDSFMCKFKMHVVYWKK